MQPGFSPLALVLSDNGGAFFMGAFVGTAGC